MTIEVLKNQSLFDIAVQTTGDVANVFLIAIANGMEITDMPQAGVVLTIPPNIAPNTKVTAYYSARNLKSATGADVSATIEGEGIEFWYMEYDFVVS